jgi:LPXTG-motif cell wall-anchored protein
MKSLNAIRWTAALLGVAIATAAGAQAEQQQRFPTERTQLATCGDVSWNEDMLRYHPNLIDACREVVVAGGRTWARFDATFVRVERDGLVVFSVRDQRDRPREEVRLMPAPGQVAYINNRATPFRQLRAGDSVNLYVPEAGYGFATEPGAPSDQLATVVAPGVAPAAQPTVAQRDPLPQVLPRTASSLPWLAFAGLMAMFGGLSLSVLRRRVATAG